MLITLNQIPVTIQEFQTCLQLDLSKPENTCAMFLCALQLYIKDKDAGVEAMNMLRGPRPMAPYDIQFLRDRLRDKPYLPLAYFEGATPQNNYTPAQPYVLNVLPDPRSQDIEAGYIRVFLKQSLHFPVRCPPVSSGHEAIESLLLPQTHCLLMHILPCLLMQQL